MVDAPVPGKRQRKSQKTRWKDTFKIYILKMYRVLKVKNVLDKAKWNNYIQNHSGDPGDGKSPGIRSKCIHSKN